MYYIVEHWKDRDPEAHHFNGHLDRAYSSMAEALRCCYLQQIKAYDPTRRVMKLHIVNGRCVKVERM